MWYWVTRNPQEFHRLTGCQRDPRVSGRHRAAILKTYLGEICRYTSGIFNNNQLNYDINEKELLAIIKGINKFEVFLLPKPFIIKTDNTQVVGFIKNNTEKGLQARRLSKCQTLLSCYNFKIVHIKCTDNFLAKFLSRNVELYEPPTMIQALWKVL